MSNEDIKDLKYDLDSLRTSMDQINSSLQIIANIMLKKSQKEEMQEEAELNQSENAKAFVK